VPVGFWKESKNQKRFLLLAKQLEYSLFSDWYNVKVDHFTKYGGKGLLYHYNNSPLNAVMNAVLSIYPEFNWAFWKFKFIPMGFWNDINNQTIGYLGDFLIHFKTLGTMEAKTKSFMASF